MQTLYRTDKLESYGEALAVLQFARGQVGAHGTGPGAAVPVWGGGAAAGSWLSAGLCLGGAAAAAMLVHRQLLWWHAPYCLLHTSATLGCDLPGCRACLVQAAKQARNLTHPLLCLDAIQYGIEHGGRAGLKKVGTAAAPLFALLRLLRWASCCWHSTPAKSRWPAELTGGRWLLRGPAQS